MNIRIIKRDEPTDGIVSRLIKGVRGEFYPCKPDIFEQTYDIVEG